MSDDCYLAALRILNYRFNSEGELRRKLAAKKFDFAERYGDEIMALWGAPIEQPEHDAADRVA